MTNLVDLEDNLSKPIKKLLKSLSGIKKNVCQFGQTQAPQTIYRKQITYCFTVILSRLLDTPKHSNENLDNKDKTSDLA